MWVVIYSVDGDLSCRVAVGYFEVTLTPGGATPAPTKRRSGGGGGFFVAEAD